MAKTTAERQANYRARRATAAEDSGERRLNTWVSKAAHLELARIAQRYGVTQREMLERFILVDDERAKPAPIKRDAVTDHGPAKVPSYGMLESRVMLLSAENIGLADRLQAALDEVAALKDALAKSQSVTRHGRSTMKNHRRNP